MNVVKKYIFIIVLAVIFLIIYFLPFKFTYSFDSHAKIMPMRQWILMRGSDGFLIESSRNILTGVNDFYRVNQFDRGSTVEVKLNPSANSSTFINKGDTLGAIYSSASYQRYVALQGQIKTAKAQLEAGLSGEKQSIIKTAEDNLRLAESEQERQEKITERLKVLNEKKLSSDEEYQLAADNLRSLRLTVEVRKSELESAKTGLKDSEINQLKIYIESLTDEMKSLEEQLSSLFIIAPFSGRIERVYSTDTLLVLSDTDELFAAIPVPLEDEQFLDENSFAFLYDKGNEFQGDIIELNNIVNLVSGKQCVTMTASIRNQQSGLHSGMIVKTKIKGRPITLREYLSTVLY